MDEDEKSNLFQNNANKGHERGNKRRYTVDPALTLVLFAWNLSSSIVPNQLLRQTCLTYGYNATKCSQVLGKQSAEAIEEKIQPQVATILMVIALLNSVVPAVMSLLLGPWTDKFGRKKVICATMLGHTVTLALFGLISTLPNANPWLYVPCYIPMVITGGWSTMILSILCYVTDSTNEANRSSRLVINEMMVLLGVCGGTASSSQILQLTSPPIVFVISSCCALLALVYTIVFIEEVLEVKNVSGVCDQINAIFSLTPLVEMIKTCFKPRHYLKRKVLWCLIVVLVLHSLVLDGTSNVFYLFVRQKLKWTLKEETFFLSVNFLVSIVGIIICLRVFKKCLGLTDFTLAFFGVVCLAGDSLIKALAESSKQMYASVPMSFFKILLSSMSRSLISTVVAGNEIGKVFCMISSLEALASLIASPLYTFIYSLTLKTFAGAFYIINISVCFVNIILLLLAKKAKMRSTNLSSYGFVTDYKTFVERFPVEELVS